MRDDVLLFGRVVRFWSTIIFKGEFQGRLHKECARINRGVPCVVCTVSKFCKVHGATVQKSTSQTIYSKQRTHKIGKKRHKCGLKHA